MWIDLFILKSVVNNGKIDVKEDLQSKLVNNIIIICDIWI